jgi:hypothetical protein
LPPPNPLTPAPLLAPAFATPASVGAYPAAPPGSGGRGAEYVKYTEKRNRLTPEDDERMRQFFEHGPPGKQRGKVGPSACLIGRGDTGMGLTALCITIGVWASRNVCMCGSQL